MTLKKFSRNDMRRDVETDGGNRRIAQEHRYEKHMRNAFRSGFHPELLNDDELDDLGLSTDENEHDGW